MEHLSVRDGGSVFVTKVSAIQADRKHISCPDLILDVYYNTRQDKMTEDLVFQCSSRAAEAFSLISTNLIRL